MSHPYVLESTLRILVSIFTASLFSCIFLLISTYLLLFSTCRALHLLLPTSGTTYFHVYLYLFSSIYTYFYLYLPRFTYFYFYLYIFTAILNIFTRSDNQY